MKNRYSTLSIFNFIFGICAIVLYLPYTISAFNLKGFSWLTDIAPDLLKDKYFDALIYFGIFILGWFIVINVLSLLSRPNLPKLLFKVSAISALLLPLITVLCFKFDWAMEFYVKNIAKNIKTISLAMMAISCGAAVLGLCSNFTRRNRANMHHILQAIVMCALLVLMVAVYGWCGWKVSEPSKVFGILMGLFAIYLPLSSIILFMLRKKRD